VGFLFFACKKKDTSGFSPTTNSSYIPPAVYLSFPSSISGETASISYLDSIQGSHLVLLSGDYTNPYQNKTILSTSGAFYSNDLFIIACKAASGINKVKAHNFLINFYLNGKITSQHKFNLVINSSSVGWRLDSAKIDGFSLPSDTASIDRIFPSYAAGHQNIAMAASSGAFCLKYKLKQ